LIPASRSIPVGGVVVEPDAAGGCDRYNGCGDSVGRVVASPAGIGLGVTNNDRVNVTVLWT